MATKVQDTYKVVRATRAGIVLVLLACTAILLRQDVGATPGQSRLPETPESMGTALVRILGETYGEVIAHSTSITDVSTGGLQSIRNACWPPPFETQPGPMAGYVIQEVTPSRRLPNNYAAIINEWYERGNSPGADLTAPRSVEKVWRIVVVGGPFSRGMICGDSDRPADWSIWVDGEYLGRGWGHRYTLSLLVHDPSALLEGGRIGIKSPDPRISDEVFYYHEPLHFSRPPAQ